ncbi:MAG: succinate dehydrogenase assembly factor 2 [Planktomarina sp.]
MSETYQHQLKRLKMRSMRRGIKEMDIILSHFADTQLADLGADDLVVYDALLSENDHDLYAWVTGTAAVPVKFSPMIGLISAQMAKKPK